MLLLWTAHILCAQHFDNFIEITIKKVNFCSTLWNVEWITIWDSGSRSFDCKVSLPQLKFNYKLLHEEFTSSYNIFSFASSVSTIFLLLKKGTCVCKKERWTLATQASEKVVTRAFTARILIRLMSKLNTFFRPVFTFSNCFCFSLISEQELGQVSIMVSAFLWHPPQLSSTSFVNPGPLSTCSVFHLQFQVRFLKGSLYYHRPYTFGGGWS